MCCAEKLNDFCNTVVLNPDVTGTGVRVAIYVQTILSMTVSSFLPYHETAFRNISRNSYVASTSLIIASLIQWKTIGLSLNDALIVSMLTSLMTAFVAANASYIRTLGLSVNISSFLFTALWCYWGIQVWANPASFGLPDGTTSTQCNASTKTVFVIFGENISIRNSGLRVFAILVFVAVMIIAISKLWQCIWWTWRYIAGGPRAAKDMAAIRLARRLHEARIRGNKREHVARFGSIATVIYMVVTIEQIVARNVATSSEVPLDRWTYSQTIALVMLGQQLMDTFTYVQEEIQYRRRRPDMY